MATPPSTPLLPSDSQFDEQYASLSPAKRKLVDQVRPDLRQACADWLSNPPSPVAHRSRDSQSTVSDGSDEQKAPGPRRDSEEDEHIEDVGEAPKNAKEKEGKWQYHGKRGHLTYKGWIAFLKIKAMLENHRELEGWSFVHENGHKKGIDYQHTHVAFNFKTAINTKKCTAFDIDGVHPHFKAIQNAGQWNNVVRYHQKEPVKLEQHGCDQVSDDEHERFVLWIKKDHPTWRQVMDNKDFFKLVARHGKWCKEQWQVNKPVPESDFDIEQARPWQVKECALAGLCPWSSTDANNLVKPHTAAKAETWAYWGSRLIKWFWGPGGVGKSIFAIWLARDCGYVYLNHGKFNDLSYVVAQADDPKGIVFDLGKSFNATPANLQELFTNIENLKNGYFVSSKYESRTVTLSRYLPCYVFANFPPPLDGSVVSKDRVQYSTFEIDEEGKCAALDDFYDCLDIHAPEN